MATERPRRGKKELTRYGEWEYNLQPKLEKIKEKLWEVEDVLDKREVDGTTEVLVKWRNWEGSNTWVGLDFNPELSSFLESNKANPDSCLLNRKLLDIPKKLPEAEILALRQVIFDSLGDARHTLDGNIGRQSRVTVKLPFSKKVFDKKFRSLLHSPIPGDSGANVSCHLTVEHLTEILGVGWSNRRFSTSTETFVSHREYIHMWWGYKERVDYDHSKCQRCHWMGEESCHPETCTPSTSQVFGPPWIHLIYTRGRRNMVTGDISRKRRPASAGDTVQAKKDLNLQQRGNREIVCCPTSTGYEEKYSLGNEDISRLEQYVDMESVPVTSLCESLQKFYCEARPCKGDELYGKNTLINIRAAINRHLADIKRDVDIVRDKTFKTGNGVLDGLFKERTRCGLSKPVVHKKIIESYDLEKIASYLNNAPSSPVILCQCVWYLLAIHFISRGTEFHHQLKLTSFTFHKDESGKYVALDHETQEKNHQGVVKSECVANEKRMYATGTASCPVEMLRLLINKTDPNAVHLFNQYTQESVLHPTCAHTWFTTKPLAKRTFFSFLTDICKAASVETKYTPHCLRATSIQLLNDHGDEARHIMLMSGHKSEASLWSYNRNMSTNQKKSISSTLSSMSGNSESKHASEVLPSKSLSAISPTCRPTSDTPFTDRNPVGLVLPQYSIQEHTPHAGMTQINPSTNNITPGFFANSTFNGCSFTFSHV